ncbi:MAG: VOC family protein [Paracoccaceae bacterium]
MTEDDEAGYGLPGDGRCRFWITRPFDGKPASVGNGSMPAFVAPDQAAVRAFHAAGLAAGGKDEGAPGLRPYGPAFYAAYLRDPDGNKLSAVHEG